MNENCFDPMERTHKLGMKFITDLVIVHRSTEHKWFKESRSSKTNPKRDSFIQRPLRGYDENAKPISPNNWRSVFGQHEPLMKPQNDFYPCLFAISQVGSNWKNLDCRKTIYGSAAGYWLDHNVSNFRISAITGLYSKFTIFPNF